jgi:transcriptional regulator with PAS, ATPase and Fis domain
MCIILIKLIGMYCRGVIILGDNDDKNKLDELTSFLFQVMAKDTDVFIANGEGIALKINENYKKNYQVTEEDIVGKRVEELEAAGIFSPSVTRMVLQQRKKVTIMQRNQKGEEFLTTGVPIFDETGNIAYVVSFPAVDIAGISDFNQKYRKLSEMVSKYAREIENIKGRSNRIFRTFN